MDFPKPNQIHLSAVFLELRKDLDILQKEIDAARPFSNVVVSKIANKLLGDRVHQSNAIEGNTLSLRETVRVLETGQMIDVGRRRESLEALNLGKAIAEIQQYLDRDAEYSSKDLFLSVHRILFTELRNDIAGIIRSDRVMIRGAKYQPPRSPDEYLAEFFESLNQVEGVDPVVLAVWCHWAIARIHPFEDGNGRMSRLWQDFVLLKHHYTPAILPVSQQAEYYQALTNADEGDFDPLLQMVVVEATRTSQTYLNVIRENDEALLWAKGLVKDAEQRIDDALKLEYSRWISRVLELRDAFQRCATLLNRASSDFVFELYNYPVIPQATWESLRSEPRTPQTGCFRITASATGKRFSYVFFAGKHFRNNNLALDLHESGPLVNILVSEQCGPGVRDILREGNSPVSLREILIHDGKMSSTRWDQGEEMLIHEVNVSSMKVAQRFFEEVIRYRLSIVNP